MAARDLAPASADPSGSHRLVAALVGAGLRGVESLPPEWALRLAAAAGRAWARAGGPRTGVARTNLRIAFPDWSEAERERVLVRSFEHLAMALVELGQMGGLDRDALRERVTIEGVEHFESARERAGAGGVVILTAHFGSWELLAVAMSAWGYPLTVVHRPRDNPALDALALRLRRSSGTEFLPRGAAARGALRALRDGRCLAMPYDQNCSRSEGVFVPFLGRLACTRDAPPRLAMRTGAPVVPVFLHRDPDRLHHVARVRPEVPLLRPARRHPTPEEVEENARRLTRVVEDEIRRAPDHWTWGHRRWRTQPPGEGHPYRRGI